MVSKLIARLFLTRYAGREEEIQLQARSLTVILLLVLPLLGFIALITPPDLEVYLIFTTLAVLVLVILLVIRSGHLYAAMTSTVIMLSGVSSFLVFERDIYVNLEVYMLATFQMLVLFISSLITYRMVFSYLAMGIGVILLVLDYLIRALPSVAPGQPAYYDDHAAAILMLMLSSFMVHHTITRRRKLLTRTRKEMLENQQHLQQLKDSRALLSAVIAESPIGMLVSKPDGTIIGLNRAMTHLIGLPDQDTLAPAFNIQHQRLKVGYLDAEHNPVPPDDRPLSRVLSGQPPLNSEFQLLNEGQPIRWVIQQALPIRDSDGTLLAAFTTMVDITDRKLAEEALRGSLNEKEILLREVHHRVKNNLNVVIGLLRLQIGTIKTIQDADTALQDSISRIFSMALVHERLYDNSDFSSVEFNEYLTTLLDDLVSSYKVPNIDIDLQVTEIPLDINTAVPCGLIINELLTNVFKHAFPQGQDGHVILQLTREAENNIRLSVRDDGVGFDPEKWGNSKSLGAHLVTSLTEQLKGTLELSTESGTEITIIFPQ